MSHIPQSTEPLIDRIRFDIIAHTRHGTEWRIQTDGAYVKWKATDTDAATKGTP